MLSRVVIINTFSPRVIENWIEQNFSGFEVHWVMDFGVQECPGQE